MFTKLHIRALERLIRRAFSLAGVDNEENPLVFVDLNDNSYFHFVSNEEPAIGHLDGLLATDDSLFVADISPTGGYGAGTGNTGVIYQIQSIVGPTGLDLNGAGQIDQDDATLVCELSDPTGTLTSNGFLPGDLNLDGTVAFADFLTLSASFGAENAHYGMGDIDCSSDVGFADFLTLSANFGESNQISSVPEPTTSLLLTTMLFVLPLHRRRLA